MVPEVVFHLAEGVGRVPVEQLVYENTKSPNVALEAVGAVDEALRRHVERRTDVQVNELVSE